MRPEAGYVFLAGADRAALAALGDALVEAGYRVESEEEASRVLGLVSAHLPDLLVVDVSLLGSSPIELLRTLRSRPATRDLPVILMAPRGEDDMPILAFRAGAADFVRRPFSLEETSARLVSHVERGRALRDARREAATHEIVLDVLRDVTASLSQEEIFNIVVRRMGSLFGVRRASMILVDADGRWGTMVAAHDDPTIRSLRIDLSRYPEIRQALESGSPVLVRELQTSALFESLKAVWASEGIKVDLQSLAVVPFHYGDGRAGVLFLRSGTGEPALNEDVIRVSGSVVQNAVRALERAAAFESVRSQQEQFEVLAKTDELTGCLSRRFVMHSLATEMERATRYRRLLAVAMFDIDDFKQLNDTHGHAVGDEALRIVGLILRRSLRASDFVGRYGGDEFLVVLPETGRPGALQLAERVRSEVAAEPRILRGIITELTVSGGLAIYPDVDVTGLDSLVERADRALYRAKSTGRNRISE